VLKYNKDLMRVITNDTKMKTKSTFNTNKEKIVTWKAFLPRN